LTADAGTLLFGAGCDGDPSTLDEIREHFRIDENRVPKILRISEFHGFTMLNRGGSALGRASAKVKMVFKPA